MPRLFVAIPLSEELQEKIQPLLGELSFFKQNLKPVESHHLHLTLQFLGDLDESQIPAIIILLESCRIGQPPFPIHFNNIGAFISGKAEA